jgi:hypothetical protein
VKLASKSRATVKVAGGEATITFAAPVKLGPGQKLSLRLA